MYQIIRVCAVTVVLFLCLSFEASAGSGQGDDAFTMWGVFFNDPSMCSGECGEDDLFGPAMTSVVFLTGQRVQSNGRASFAASYGEGSTVGALFGPGLLDSDAAEVHLIVRSHSRFQTSLADAQITTVDGGCDDSPGFPASLCEDLQFAVFLADGNTHQTVSVFRFSDGSQVKNAWASIWREADGIRVALHTRVP